METVVIDSMHVHYPRGLAKYLSLRITPRPLYRPSPFHFHFAVPLHTPTRPRHHCQKRDVIRLLYPSVSLQPFVLSNSNNAFLSTDLRK